MSEDDLLYKLANRDVTLSRIYNEFMCKEIGKIFKHKNDSKELVKFIESHVCELNDQLQININRPEAYIYLSERILFWANVLLHEFEVYVDFTIPSPKSLFGDD